LNNQSEIQSPKSKVDWLILLFLIFIPRLLNLDVFLTADEPLFLQQSREFAAGLSSGDFSQTLGIGYPGVTVAWWAAPVVGLAQTEWSAYVAGRIVVVLANGLLLLIMYGLALRLVGRWPAFLSVGLLALDPYTMAYSRLLHIEAPLALFMTLAGLAFLLWLRDSRRHWLLLTGLFTGLALLTKSTALLLGPMLIALLVGWIITHYALRTTSFVFRLSSYIQKLAGLVAVAFIAALIFVALWPAMWVDPAGALGLTFGKLFADQEAGTGNYGMFWLGRFVQDPGPFFYPVAFLLKATPWLLLGLGLSLWQVISSFVLGRKNGRRNTPDVSLPLWLFTLTYLILMTLASKKSVRYLLPAFPTFYLLAGLALVQFSRSAGQYASRLSAKPPSKIFPISRLTPHASRLTPPASRSSSSPLSSSSPSSTIPTILPTTIRSSLAGAGPRRRC
jgi:4-amino-4-deoxy-L-arabinose transferase-like glycosyltransferase